MSITAFYAEVEAIIPKLSPVTIYRRATSKEANLDLENLAISTFLAISVDRTTMVITTGGGGYQSMEIPLEMYFVQKQPSQDETLDDNDVIVDACADLAIQFYQFLQQTTTQDVLDATIPLPDFNLDRLTAYELWDTVVTGVLMELNVPVSVEEYNCRPA